MSLRALGAIAAIVAVAAVVGINRGEASAPTAPLDWNPQAAATYLDQRQSWWESWRKSARDHGTACISCHTTLPYALARPELRAILRESEVSPAERKLVADVVTRVRAWSEVKPFYGDTTPNGRLKAAQSRGTEAVLNALVLAWRDHETGMVSADTRHALANMFALQQTHGAAAGAWQWLNFELRPWESGTAEYFGAALSGIAVGLEPQGYSQRPEIQHNLELLRSYLRSHRDQPIWNRLLRRDDPNLFNRAMLLWASSKLSGLLSSDEQRSIVQALSEAQESDGSWKLASLGRWQHAAGLRATADGDGYATGLVAYALEQSGVGPDDAHLARALAWLARHQDSANGMWRAASLNKLRDPQSDVGKFMSDAATAFAVLALAAPMHDHELDVRPAGLQQRPGVTHPPRSTGR